MGFRIKVDPADKIFSQYIREKAKWKCEYCGKDYSDNHQGLHASHYWSRSHESTRYDPDNVCALCFYHHRLLGHGEGRDEYREFMVKRLGGENNYKILKFRAHSFQRKDRKMSLIVVNELLKSIKI